MTYLAPLMAVDAKPINLALMVTGITNKNFGERKAALLSGITKAMDGKLAKDAELDHLPELLDALERTDEPEGRDDELQGSPQERQGLLPGLDAGREFLQGKLSAEDLATYDAMCSDEPSDREEMAERMRKKAEEDKKAKDAAEAEEKKKEEEEEAEDKRAMDAAIKAGIQAERDRQSAIRAAEKAIRPYVGEMAQAFDSAEAIYTHGLKAMGVTAKLDGLPLNALQAILESQPRPGSQPRKEPIVALDAAASKSFSELFGTNHMPAVI